MALRETRLRLLLSVDRRYWMSRRYFRLVSGLVLASSSMLMLGACLPAPPPVPPIPTTTTTTVAPAVPSAPNITAATPGNAQASITWMNGATNGSNVLGYKIYVTSGQTLVQTKLNCTGSPCTVAGLANSTAYTFQVSEVNGIGEGQRSAISLIVTPGDPGAPHITAATPGNAQATIAWMDGASNGSAIQTSKISAYIGQTLSQTKSDCTGSPCTVNGLANNTTYTFQVSALNGVGEGPHSTSSPIVTPGFLPAPSAFVASSQSGQAMLTWAAPTSPGSSPVTGYSVSSVPVVAPPSGCTMTTNLTCTFSGLTNGVVYSFSAEAQNALGPGAFAHVSARPNPTPPTSAKVELWGDSLSFQSNPYLKQILAAQNGVLPITTYGYPGTALCDWLSQIQTVTQGASANDVVVLEFAGDAMTPCITAAGAKGYSATIAQYESDLRATITTMLANGVGHIIVVGIPATGPPGGSQTFEPALNVMYQQTVASFNNAPVTYVVSGTQIDDPITGGFTMYRACLPYEILKSLCTGPMASGVQTNIVRNPDGVHFCVSSSDYPFPCLTWSSGAWRFASAMATAVEGVLGLPDVGPSSQ